MPRYVWLARRLFGRGCAGRQRNAVGIHPSRRHHAPLFHDSLHVRRLAVPAYGNGPVLLVIVAAFRAHGPVRHGVAYRVLLPAGSRGGVIYGGPERGRRIRGDDEFIVRLLRPDVDTALRVVLDVARHVRFQIVVQVHDARHPVVVRGHALASGRVVRVPRHRQRTVRRRRGKTSPTVEKERQARYFETVHVIKAVVINVP